MKTKQLKPPFEQHKLSIDNLCRKHNVNNMYLFGSFSRGTQKRNSDIDFLVNFGEVDLYEYFDNYIDLKMSLEALFKRKVDLLEEKSIKNPVLKETINESKQLIYSN